MVAFYNDRRIINILLVFLITVLVLLVFPPCLFAENEVPENVRIERTWSMVAYGETIGMIRSVRESFKDKKQVLIKDTFSSMVGVDVGVQMNSTEEMVISRKGMTAYSAVFQTVGKDDKTTIKGELNGNQFRLGLLAKGENWPYEIDFTKDKDYHWSTSYIAFDRLNLKKNQIYQKKILDIYAMESRDVKVEYLGDETVRQGENVFNCHMLQFDYGVVKGTFWLAKDELGYFLVKEKAESKDGPFELILDEYNKTGVGQKQTKGTVGNSNKSGQGFGF